MLKDIHTHHLFPDPEKRLLSTCFKEAGTDLFCQAENLSVGIHPWYLSDENFEQQLEWLHAVLSDRRVLAIGEGGLDKCCDTPFELQLRAFEMQIQLSEEHQLPLVIHCVKCTAELLRLKKEYKPHLPWIIHGFRGKPQQAAEYLRHGFYLSYGAKYAEASLQQTPLDRLFIETDESTLPLGQLYQRAASLQDIPIEKFEESVLENINHVF